MQYAHARIASILREAARERGGAGARGGPATALHPSERALIKKLLAFPAEVAEAAERRAPHRIAAYALELAQDVHGLLPRLPGAEGRAARPARLPARAVPRHPAHDRAGAGPARGRARRRRCSRAAVPADARGASAIRRRVEEGDPCWPAQLAVALTIVLVPLALEQGRRRAELGRARRRVRVLLGHGSWCARAGSGRRRDPRPATAVALAASASASATNIVSLGAADPRTSSPAARRAVERLILSGRRALGARLRVHGRGSPRARRQAARYDTGFRRRETDAASYRFTRTEAWGGPPLRAAGGPGVRGYVLSPAVPNATHVRPGRARLPADASAAGGEAVMEGPSRARRWRRSPGAQAEGGEHPELRPRGCRRSSGPASRGGPGPSG